MSTALGTRRNRLGESAARPDGVPKVRGQFAYSGDLFAEGMLWGHIVRSPHPSAIIRGIDVSAALAIDGVRAVITSDDVPGRKTYGLDYPDQPVFAWDVVRYMGEAVAAVAADHPETARRAAAAIAVDYVVTEPVTDATSRFCSLTAMLCVNRDDDVVVTASGLIVYGRLRVDDIMSLSTGPIQ